MAAHGILLNETDQTVALVIAYAPLHCGVDILVQFALDRQAEIVRSIAGLQPESRPHARPTWTRIRNMRLPVDGSKWLEKIWQGRTLYESREIGGVGHAGKLLEMFDTAARQSILEHLARDVPALAQEIQQHVFTFEDIARLANADIQVLTINIPRVYWAIALTGASEELKDRIFANMSKRVAMMLKEEMEVWSQMTPSQVAEVQHEIVYILHVLENEGEITLR